MPKTNQPVTADLWFNRETLETAQGPAIGADQHNPDSLAHAFEALGLNPADAYNQNGLASTIPGLGLSRAAPPTSNSFPGLEEAAALVPCPILNYIDYCIIMAQVPLSTISLSLRERGVSLSLAILTKIVAAKRFLVEVAILDVRLDDSKLTVPNRIRLWAL
jgi:hypothetical protein